MTTDVPSWRTNNHTKRTTGCRARTCLPDLTVFARSRDYSSGKFAPKGKSDTCSADAEKANKSSDRVNLRGKLRIPSVNLRPIQLLFSYPFYRSSTHTSRSSTLRTLIFPRKKHALIKRKVRVLKISESIIESRSCTDHTDNFGSSLVSQFFGSVLRQFL